MKLFLPDQHGAWAMLIIPFWIGVVAQGFMWQHIFFFLGWLLLYLATYPMLQLFKKRKMSFHLKWTAIYLIPALLLLLIPLITRPSIIYFGLAMIPFFMINIYFSSKKNDRAFLNDISAIISFCIAGLASSYLPAGEIGEKAIYAFVLSFLFFVGTTFYVKTMIRERNNIKYKYYSWIYHFVVPIGFFLFGKWLYGLAFISSLFRAIYYYGKKMSMKQIGILEIVNAAIFFIIVTIAFVL